MGPYDNLSPREKRQLERKARKRDKPVLRQIKKNTKKIKKQEKNFADKKSGCVVAAIAVAGTVVGVIRWRIGA